MPNPANPSNILDEGSGTSSPSNATSDNSVDEETPLLVVTSKRAELTLDAEIAKSCRVPTSEAESLKDAIVLPDEFNKVRVKS